LIQQLFASESIHNTCYASYLVGDKINA